MAIHFLGSGCRRLPGDYFIPYFPSRAFYLVNYFLLLNLERQPPRIFPDSLNARHKNIAITQNLCFGLLSLVFLKPSLLTLLAHSQNPLNQMKPNRLAQRYSELLVRETLVPQAICPDRSRPR